MEEAKLAAAQDAAEYVYEHVCKFNYADKPFVLGVGSGSTIAQFTPLLTKMLSKLQDVRIIGIPTSYQAQEFILQSHIVQLGQLNVYPSVDLIVDGADEIFIKDGKCFMIKGGGGCMLDEKIVAQAASHRIYIADNSKLSNERLGQRAFPIPVEVHPDAVSPILQLIRQKHRFATVRQCKQGKAGPIVTDAGNLIIDLIPDGPFDPEELNIWLNNIAGVIEHGLFFIDVDLVIIGYGQGMTRRIIPCSNT